jgi:hypothetical protein
VDGGRDLPREEVLVFLASLADALDKLVAELEGVPMRSVT